MKKLWERLQLRIFRRYIIWGFMIGIDRTLKRLNIDMDTVDRTDFDQALYISFKKELTSLQKKGSK